MHVYVDVLPQILELLQGTVHTVRAGNGLKTNNAHLIKGVVDLEIMNNSIADFDFCSSSLVKLNINGGTVRSFQGMDHLKVLILSRCDTITDDCFNNLRSIESLTLRGCALITDKAFSHLQGAKLRKLVLMSQRTLTDNTLAYLQGMLQELDISGHPKFTDAGISYLQGTITRLDISNCSQPTITDKAFSYLQGTIRHLKMFECSQSTITDKAFEYISGTIQTLDMNSCHQETITNEAYKSLSKGPIWKLQMLYCGENVTPEVLGYFSSKVQVVSDLLDN